MNNLLKLYEESKSPRVADAKKIPELKTNFFDTNSEFQDEFTTFHQYTGRNEDTKFTSKALGYYDDEVKSIFLPESFVPLDPRNPIHRYGVTKPYYNPGESGTEGR